MKALSIKQPWAELIMRGVKDVENRTWETNYRGPLLIHAGKNIDKVALQSLDPEYYHFKMLLSGILGIVDLICCVRIRSSRWHDEGYIGFYLENPHRFTEPIPYKGMLSIFDVPDELVVDQLPGREA